MQTVVRGREFGLGQLDIEKLILAPTVQSGGEGANNSGLHAKEDKRKLVKNATGFHLAKSNSGTRIIADVQ
jgi:hypothetical protein